LSGNFHNSDGFPCTFKFENIDKTAFDIRFLWSRMPDSLAAGKILGESFTEPVLYLYDLVPGLYVFKLQVIAFCF